MDFDKYHITLEELAESMKPTGWLHTAAMEIGIEVMMRNLPSSSKKVIMPLRIAVSNKATFRTTTLLQFYILVYMGFDTNFTLTHL